MSETSPVTIEPFAMQLFGDDANLWRTSNPDKVFVFRAGTAGTIIGLVNIGQRLSTQAVLPPMVRDGELEIHFTDDGDCELANGFSKTSIKYTFDEGEALIELLNVVSKAVIVKQQIQGRGRYTHTPAKGHLV